MTIRNTNQAIEAMVDASGAAATDMRHRHVLRESLRSLVRQAKAEQLLEVRRSAALASGFTVESYTRYMPRAPRGRRSWPGQGELEF